MKMYSQRYHSGDAETKTMWNLSGMEPFVIQYKIGEWDHDGKQKILFLSYAVLPQIDELKPEWVEYDEVNDREVARGRG
jgi:hypothetical protein